MRYQEEANLLTTACSRAKTEDFLTFLCLRRKWPSSCSSKILLLVRDSTFISNSIRMILYRILRIVLHYIFGFETYICYGLNLFPVQIFLNWFIFFKLVNIFQTSLYFSNWFIFFKLACIFSNRFNFQF